MKTAHTIALEAAAKAAANRWHSFLERWNEATGLPYKRPSWEKESHVWMGLIADAITAYLAALAPRGLKVTPRELTTEIAEAWARLAMERLKRRLKDDSDTKGAVEGAKESYRAMHDSFVWPPK